MRIYTVKPSSTYQDLTILNREEWNKYLFAFRGESQIDEWVPISVKYNPYTLDQSRGDCTGTGGGRLLVLTEKAVEALQEVIDQTGELLPLDCEEEALWVFNVTNILEGALNLEQSVYSTISTGAISNIKKYVFYEDAVKNQYIFRMAEYPATLYATDRFKDLVEAAGLKGFKFETVYPPEEVVPHKPKSSRSANVAQQSGSVIVSYALSDEDYDLIQGSVTEGLDELGLSGQEAPLDIVKKIDAEVVRLRQSTTFTKDEPPEEAAMLGSLWGQQICRAYGWRWGLVYYRAKTIISVIAPEDTHYVAPLQTVWESLVGASPTSNLTLKFNMLAGKNLPPSKPKELMPIA